MYRSLPSLRRAAFTLIELLMEFSGVDRNYLYLDGHLE